MRNLLRSFKILFQSAGLFQQPSDALKFFAIWNGLSAGGQTVRMKCIPNVPITCRPGTTDPAVLISVFRDLYHMPDIRLPERAAILDLGANVGYSVAHLAAAFPASSVVGVEMDDENYRISCQNTAAFGMRCRMIHAAVAGSDGEITYGGDREDGFHILHSPEGSSAGRTVKSMRMDTLLNEAGLARVDYLKMDVEGAEHEIFTSDATWAKRVRHMKVEIHDSSYFPIIGKCLEQQGFECRKDTRHWSCLVATQSGWNDAHSA